MTDTLADAWSGPAVPDSPPVPQRYRGVWRRTLLETPQVRGDLGAAHWNILEWEEA